MMTREQKRKTIKDHWSKLELIIEHFTKWGMNWLGFALLALRGWQNDGMAISFFFFFHFWQHHKWATTNDTFTKSGGDFSFFIVQKKDVEKITIFAPKWSFLIPYFDKTCDISLDIEILLFFLKVVNFVGRIFEKFVKITKTIYYYP